MKLTIVIFFLLVITTINSQELDTPGIRLSKQPNIILNDSTQLKELINQADYYLKKDIAKSKKLFNEAIALMKEHDSVKKAYVFYKLGIIHRKKGQFSESYSHLFKAEKLYDKLKDTFNIVNVSLELAHLHRYLDDSLKIKQQLDKAFKLSTIINDSLLIGKTYDFMGRALFYSKKYDSTNYYYEKALGIFNRLKDSSNINLIYNNLSVLYGTQKQHTKAIKVRLKILDYLKKNNDRMGISLDYFNLSVSYLKINKLETSLKYVDSSLAIAIEEDFKYRIARGHMLKSVIYAKVNNYKEAYESSILYKKHSDSIFDIQKQKKIKELELKYEFDIERKELEIIAQKKETQNRFYILLFSLILFFMLLIGFLIWRNYNARSRIVRDKFEKEKLKKEILTQKVKTSETELKSIIADNTMRLEFIKQLSKQIKTDKNLSQSKDVKNYTNTLLLKLQQQISTESKLSLLQDKINIINQGFDQKIIELFPSLTKTEREVCTFLRLNLSIKEIASIRNSSTDSIKAVRYRIRKKMEVSKNQELEHFIQNLSL